MSFDGNVTINIFSSAQAVPQTEFGRIGILSSDVGVGFTERYRLYQSAKELSDDTDVNSALRLWCAQMFGQSVNSGQLAVLRADPSEAMVEKWTIGGVIANLDTFTIIVNGISVTDTATVPADDAAAVALSLRALLTAALAAEDVTVSGAGVEVIVTADHAGEEFTHSCSKVSVAGTITASATTPNVTLADSLSAIKAENDTWYGLVTDSRDAWELIAIAAWVANDASKCCALQSNDADILTAGVGNVLATLKATNNPRVFFTYYSDDSDPVDLCWLSYKLAKDPDDGTTMWSGATLVGPAFDTLTSTQQTNVESQYGNAYLSEGGIGATGPGKLVDGRWIDTIVTKDWFRARVREAATQLRLNMSSRNLKIPFDNTGIAMFESCLRKYIALGEQVGHFEKGTAVVQSPDIADISDADRLLRKLTIPSNVTLLGGIEKVVYNLAVLDVT
ncbi:MAG: DUF3383 family protein [Patescibacteria group bacterium]